MEKIIPQFTYQVFPLSFMWFISLLNFVQWVKDLCTQLNLTVMKLAHSCLVKTCSYTLALSKKTPSNTNLSLLYLICGLHYLSTVFLSMCTEDWNNGIKQTPSLSVLQAARSSKKFRSQNKRNTAQRWTALFK